MAMGLLEKVEQEIEQQQLLSKQEVVIVAVSGGPDSVALLHVLHTLAHKWEWKLVVTHVNHQFRIEESAEEAEYVRCLAMQLEWPCEIAVINIPEYMSEHALNAQLAAREKRYQFLHRTAEKYGAGKIALGHHADDQAETLLMRFIRGTGPSGLSGIPVRRSVNSVELIRPLLRIYKTELIRYCDQEHLSPRIDSSNQERKYFRNQVRLDVLPYLQQLNPQLSMTLNRLADMMAAENDYMETETRHIFERHVSVQAAGYYFSRDFFLQLPVALQRRLIKLILSYLSAKSDLLDYTQVELVRSAILQQNTPSMHLDLGSALQLHREYDRVGLLKNAHPIVTSYRYTVNQQDVMLYIEEAGMTLSFSRMGSEEYNEQYKEGLLPAQSAAFDLEQLKFPLVIRSRETGDRIQVIGLNGSKKVKDIFIDAKIPPSRRNCIPLVAHAAGEILWIIGIRRSIHAQLSDHTRNVYLLKWIEQDQSS